MLNGLLLLGVGVDEKKLCLHFSLRCMFSLCFRVAVCCIIKYRWAVDTGFSHATQSKTWPSLLNVSFGDSLMYWETLDVMVLLIFGIFQVLMLQILHKLELTFSVRICVGTYDYSRTLTKDRLLSPIGDCQSYINIYYSNYKIRTYHIALHGRMVGKHEQDND